MRSLRRFLLASHPHATGLTIWRPGNLVVSGITNLACAIFAAAIVACPSVSVQAAERYEFGKYGIAQLYSGEIHFPDFKGRDRKFSMYRTRIHHALEKGPDFAGRYSVVTIGCGTDCSFGYIADASIGRVVELPRGGEEFMDLRYDYRIDSSLIVARWRSLELGRCYEEAFVWRDDKFENIDKKDVGDIDVCLADWPKK